MLEFKASESDVSESLKGSSIDYATLLARHNALVEAVKKMLDVECGANEPYCLGDYTSARAEVDRLLGGE